MSETMLSLMFPLHGVGKLPPEKQQTQEQAKSESVTSPLNSNMILFGEANNIYRTSLLFQACLSATTINREAIFITKNKFITLPFFVQQMPMPNPDLLKLIKFKYFYKSEQVIEFFSKIVFEKFTPPALIVLDDIISFCDPSSVENELDYIRQTAMICAHAKHALNNLTSKSECSLIVSCRKLNRDSYFRFYFDSFAYMKTIEKDMQYEVDYLEKDRNTKTNIKFRVQDASLLLDSFNVQENVVHIKTL